jgi:hypothetical protein
MGDILKDRLRSMQELNYESPEYEARMLTTETRLSESSLFLSNKKFSHRLLNMQKFFIRLEKLGVYILLIGP